MPRDEWVDPNPMEAEHVRPPVGRHGADEDADPQDQEARLRPRSLAEFVGQAELKDRLGIILDAAARRSEPPDHLLFAGPPGLGKTTLAGIVAAELGSYLHVTSGPALERAGDLASMLTNLQQGDVLFIDEIHRLPRAVEEILYPAMEDLQIDVVLGKGPSARSIRFDVEPFTLVAATTRTGLITGPLRDRFGFDFRLEHYSTADLQAIVERSATIFDVDITPDGASEIAGRSRGTPRIAIRLLKRVRDYAEMRAAGVVDHAAASAGLEMFGIDVLGLDRIDNQLLDNLCRRFAGGPVGLSTLAISVGEPTDTIEEVIEPFLIQQGLLVRTPRGRMATGAAWSHVGLTPPAETDDPGPIGLFGDD